jgi:hypothetical protein
MIGAPKKGASMGICPHCKKRPSEITIEDITLNGGGGKKWNGITYSCSSCHSVLNVGFDPLTLNSDLLDEIRAIVPGS